MIGRQAGRQRQRQRQRCGVKVRGDEEGLKRSSQSGHKGKERLVYIEISYIHTCILVHTYIHMYNEQINKYI